MQQDVLILLFVILALPGRGFQASTGLNYRAIFGPNTSVSRPRFDSAGNIYVAGSTTDPNFPVTPRAFQKSFIRSQCGEIPPPKGIPGPGAPIPCRDAFVAKFNPAGTDLIYATYLRGSRDESAGVIAVDAEGNVYVAGTTDSPDFPVTDGAYQTTPGRGFLTKLNADGSGLIFSTYLPASGAIRLDKDWNIFIAGRAEGADFPTTPGAFQSQRNLGWGDIFVMKLNPSASRLLYSTLVGGTFEEFLSGFAIDSEGNAYIAGWTGSTPDYARFVPPGNYVPFPTTPEAFNRPGGASDVFIAKLNPTGTGLVYSSAFGGAGDDAMSGLFVDEQGSAYFAGYTFYSPDFPTTPGAFQSTYGGGFLGRLSPDGSRLLFSTYLGGYRGDSVGEIQVDSAGRVVVRGGTYGFRFPTSPDSRQPCFPGSTPSFYGRQPYAAILDPTGSAVIYSTYLRFAGNIISMDASGNALLPSDTAIVTRRNILSPAPPGPTCVVSAAHYRIEALAPGEIVSILGASIGPDQPVTFQLDSSRKAPSILANTRVLIGDLPAPLLYVSKNQINAVVPFGVAGRSRAVLRVERNGAVVGAPLDLPVVEAVPAIFTLDGSGVGQAAVLNQDGTINSPGNPAEQGSVVSIFATGLGRMNPVPQDGSVPSAPSAKPVLRLRLAFGPVGESEIVYAGDVPGLVQGAVQINARVPALPQTGEVNLSLYAEPHFPPIGLNTTIFVK